VWIYYIDEMNTISAKHFMVSPLGTTNFYDCRGKLILKSVEELLESINEQAIIVAENEVDINSEIETIYSSDASSASTKKGTYTPANLKAQTKYREKFREKYNEAQRLLYEKKKQEEEWKMHFLERSRLHNKKYRDKKRMELIGQGVEIKRGRPRKIKETETEK